MDEDLNSLNTGHLATPGTIDSSTCTDYEDVRSNSNNDELDSDVFTCLVCFIPFYSKLELLKHLSKIHRLTNLCRICYFDVKKIERFANPVSLRNHNLKCHSEKMVKCVCGSMLINSRMLMSHLKKFKCDVSTNGANKNMMVKCICGKRFSSQEQIIHHQSKCRKRWRYGNMLNEPTSSTSVANSQNRRTRAQTNSANNKASLRQRSMELSQKLNQVHVHCPTGPGRKPNRSNCKENIQSGEDKIDEMFRKAVVSSLYESSPYVVSENFQTSNRTGSRGDRNDRHRTSTVTFGKVESSSVSEDKELDLRTISVKNRSDNASSVPFVSENVDVNNNMSFVASAPAALLPDDSTICCVANGNHNVSNMTIQNSSNFEEIDDNNNNVSEMKGTYSNSATMEITNNILPGCTQVSNKTGKSILKLAKLKEISKRKGMDVKAKHNGKRKYACKFCRRLYTKPYLYSHQKVVHRKAHWIHVPMPTALAKPAGKYKFRCYWCHFVSAHWTIAVQHHYKHHQDKELNILCLATT